MTDSRPVWEIARETLSATDYQRVENAVRLGGKSAAGVLERSIDQDEQARRDNTLYRLVAMLRDMRPSDLEEWQQELAS